MDPGPGPAAGSATGGRGRGTTAAVLSAPVVSAMVCGLLLGSVMISRGPGRPSRLSGALLWSRLPHGPATTPNTPIAAAADAASPTWIFALASRPLTVAPTPTDAAAGGAAVTSCEPA